MRILGEIRDDLMKITVLEMNHRVSVKFEWDQMEQTYKLSLPADQDTLGHLESILVPSLRIEIMSRFKSMSETRAEMTKEESSTEDLPFLY